MELRWLSADGKAAPPLSCQGIVGAKRHVVPKGVANGTIVKLVKVPNNGFVEKILEYDGSW